MNFHFGSFFLFGKLTTMVFGVWIVLFTISGNGFSFLKTHIVFWFFCWIQKKNTHFLLHEDCFFFFFKFEMKCSCEKNPTIFDMMINTFTFFWFGHWTNFSGLIYIRFLNSIFCKPLSVTLLHLDWFFFQISPYMLCMSVWFFCFSPGFFFLKNKDLLPSYSCFFFDLLDNFFFPFFLSFGDKKYQNFSFDHHHRIHAVKIKLMIPTPGWFIHG